MSIIKKVKNMKNLSAIFFFAGAFCSVNSQASEVPNATHPALVPINSMFDAMREHNGKKLLTQFTQRAILERVNNKNEVVGTELNEFAAFVTESSKHLDEQIFNVRVNRSGNLASAWVPFAFYLDGKLSHCGVNSFQLIKQNSLWKIRYLMDNSYSGDCEKFIKQHKNQASNTKLVD